MRIPWTFSLLFSLLASVVASGCGDGSTGPSTVSPAEPPPLVTLLPESTRSVVRVDVDALSSAGPSTVAEALLAGERVDDALDAPFGLIRELALGVDVTSTMHEVLVAQSTRPQDGFVLVAKLKRPGIESVLDTWDLTEAGSYEGHALYAARTSDLRLAHFPDGRLVVGREPGVRAAIDTFEGRNPGALASAIASHLSSLEAVEPLAFVVGMPALYGDVAVPGPGAVTLRRARVVRGALSFGNQSVGGRALVYSDNAADYVARFNELIADTSTMPLSLADDGAIEVQIPESALPMTGAEVLASRALLKQLVHAMDAVDYADGVIHGGNVPWMNFDVGGDPNSIFINFEFKDQAQIEAFEREELPEGFVLAPLRILDTDEPTYFLVLNIYNSSGGLVEGARAEWSVFVEDPETGDPRFLVVQAAAENISADSVNLLTNPEPVSHVFEDGDIVSYVGVEDPDGGEERLYFSSRIVWPQIPEDRVGFAREFVAANDFIYWGNGVSDRTLYNASVHNREGVRIPDADIRIVDDSRWSPYVNPVPKHSYVYLNPLDIVISPWWNLDASYLDVTGEYRQTLIDFKNNFYPATVRGIAEASVAGKDEALAASSIGTSVPSAYYNFVVTDPAGLADALELPADLRLAAVRLLERDAAAEVYLSLRVYAVDGMPKGNRAEWTVLVDGGEGRPQTLLVDLLAEEVLPDPELGLRLPGVVDHVSADGRLRTSLDSGAIAFEADIRLAETGAALPTLDWVEAGDRVCRRNGICDKVFYDGATMAAPVALAGRDTVEIVRFSTPWDAFVAREPASVFVRHGLQRFARNPWQNVALAR